MKRFIFILAVVAGIICSCAKGSPTQSLGLTQMSDIVSPARLIVGTVEILVENGATLSTKSDDADYYTVTGVDQDVKFSIIVENVSDGDFLFQNHYNDSGEMLATLTYYKDDLVTIELNPELETPSTKGYFKEMSGCIRDEYIYLRDTAADNNPIIYDFFTGFTQVAVLITAVVDCTKKV